VENIVEEFQKQVEKLSFSVDKLGRRVTMCFAEGRTESETVGILKDFNPSQVRNMYRTVVFTTELLKRVARDQGLVSEEH
jgi:endonuclease YncB( thermonuclease family)